MIQGTPAHAEGARKLRTASFLERLHAAATAHDSWLCVGLDPESARVPPGLDLHVFLRGIVEATADLVCCFKPNIAFFEALGLQGQELLRAVLREVPSDVPVLLDAKRGDTPHTMQAYARAVFEELDVDAVTVNPYLGADSLAPFLGYAGRGVFVLCKTSNPGAAALQDLSVDGEPLFVHVARLGLSCPALATVGFVVGATYPGDVAAVRAIAPRAPILLPGVGAQAGDLESAVRAGITADGERAIVNASRTILYASQGPDWQDAARREAERLRSAINLARGATATAVG